MRYIFVCNTVTLVKSVALSELRVWSQLTSLICPPENGLLISIVIICVIVPKLMLLAGQYYTENRNIICEANVSFNETTRHIVFVRVVHLMRKKLYGEADSDNTSYHGNFFL